MSGGTENGTGRGSPVRVLHVVDSLGVGGTELGVAKVINGIRDGVSHSVCCIRAGGRTAAAFPSDVPVVCLNTPAGGDWRLAFRLARVCRQLRPQIVHTRNWGAIEGIIGAKLAGVPRIIHGEHGRHADDVEGLNKRRNRVRRILARWTDRVVAVSDQLRTWLVEVVGVEAGKISVVRGGVDVAAFAPRADRKRVRERLGYRSEDVLVGTVARLNPVRDHASLIEAVAQLVSRYPNLHLLVVGEGPARATLGGEVRNRRLADRVRFLGRRDDVAALLAAFDIFAQPSLFEGTSNAILEAMSVALPVVATRVGGNPEIVVDGATGRLVPARDPAALADAIASYAGSESARREHGLAGRARVVENFTVGHMIRGYRRVYEEVFARRLKGWRPVDRGAQSR